MHRLRVLALVPLALIPVAAVAGCGGPEQVSAAELDRKSVV